LHWAIRFSECFLFVVGLGLFIGSILSASATLKITDYKYARPDINSAFDNAISSRSDFLEGQVKDLIKAIDINSDSTLKKSNHLIRAYKFFFWGLVVMGFLACVLAFQSFIFEKNERSDLAIIKSTLLLQSQVSESQRLLDQILASDESNKDSLRIRVVQMKLDSLKVSLAVSRLRGVILIGNLLDQLLVTDSPRIPSQRT
jgi:hypothetical protein